MHSIPCDFWVELKVDPGRLGKKPLALSRASRVHFGDCLPRRVRSGPVLAHQISLDGPAPDPMLGRWTAGPFITLPLVYTEDPNRPGNGAIQPGHVPRAARRQRLHSEPGGWACIIKSTAASACITLPRSRVASHFESTSSSADHLLFLSPRSCRFRRGFPSSASPALWEGRRIAMGRAPGKWPSNAGRG